ncbi:proline-rich receptor-like protein kinase PERK9 [Gossypium hirsutum]|uniref:Proline-rich receptor-like protein kinase PERK9 n=1 Tax=Gossypium hirsutum TaxID=3635 RepID=A0A1U8I4A0_GOSHI|nr:proline-rich receptor-like protein kinase PERK9 [Gossypium hirsutum]
MDDDTCPSTRPRNSPDPSSAPITSSSPATTLTQSPDPVVQPTIPTVQPFQMMPGGSSSQHRQPDPQPDEPESPPEQPQPPPEAGQKRNPARNRRQPPCGIESGGHKN